MNKEPTKLRDLIQADDEIDVEITNGTFVMGEVFDGHPVVTEPIKWDATQEEIDAAVNKARAESLAEKVGELQTKLAIADRLSELEHEVAEAAVRWNTADDKPTYQENVVQYQRLEKEFEDAVDNLIRFKAEAKA